MTQQNYLAVNASAGSGKTYALVQNLLIKCLKYPDQPSLIKNILALTFTNKAANEMKQRIIQWLENFASAEYENFDELRNIKIQLQKQGIRLSLQELHTRSKAILDFVLHNYSALNIGTIDKFNSKLIRSFSYELGLAQNFNLEIDSEPHLLQAVDKMLDEIGDNGKISEAFIDFINYNLDSEKRVDLNKTLYASAKEYLNDKHYFWLGKSKDFDWEKYENTKTKLRKEQREILNHSKEIVKSCVDLIAERDLRAEDFSGGTTTSIAAFFEKVGHYLNGLRKFPYPTSEESALATFRKLHSSKSKHRSTDIQEIIDFLILNREQIIANHLNINKRRKILEALLPLKVNKEIQDKLSEIETGNDLVLLSKFNVMIHENLKDEPSAFIYEKIGTQFHHYFLDEFQDTSALQWKNMVPLRDHAVTSDKMSFTLVGDPKQSIYRFRGGDSQLMLDIINKKETTPVFAHVEPLQSNWRSAKNIVDFNNRFYGFLSDFVQGEHCELFGNGSQQTPQSKKEGRVRINLFEPPNVATFYEEMSYKMAADIQSCIDYGYSLSDITILCRSNTAASRLARGLTTNQVTYKGNTEFIKIISDKGLTLDLSRTVKAVTEFLRWEQEPRNNQYPVKMLYYLNSLGRISADDFTADMHEMLSGNTKAEIQAFIHRKYELDLSSNSELHLNLYNKIEFFVQKFSVPDLEVDFIFNYLELVYGYAQNGIPTLKDFLNFWDQEGQKSTVQASENLDAMKIMTIHKAKGLEFPVVLLPIPKENKDSKFTNWWESKMEGNYPAINVSGFDKSDIVYDEQMRSFNEENAYKNKIDRFCVQYVATTRAVDQLFLYIEKDDKENGSEIFKFIQKEAAVKNMEDDSFDLYDAPAEGFQKKQKAVQSSGETLSVHFRNEGSKPENIKIATPSKNYQNRVQHVRTGIFVHEVLSKIKTEKDIESVIELYVIEGTISLEEAQSVSTRIHEIVAENQEYFAEGLKIISERDIMISEDNHTQIYRPDRLIETETGFIIVDFKTGISRAEHQEQLKTYQKVLEKLGKKVLQTKIISV